MDPRLMQGFEDVVLLWQGQEYRVPANSQMMLIAKVEDAVSRDTGQQALAVMLRPEGPPYSRLAAGYATALRYAGARVSDEEVYLALQQGIADQDGAETVFRDQVLGLLALLSPPVARKLSAVEGGAPKAD
jgi:hypothetical protein